MKFPIQQAVAMSHSERLENQNSFACPVRGLKARISKRSDCVWWQGSLVEKLPLNSAHIRIMYFHLLKCFFLRQYSLLCFSSYFSSSLGLKYLQTCRLVCFFVFLLAYLLFKGSFAIYMLTWPYYGFAQNCVLFVCMCEALYVSRSLLLWISMSLCRCTCLSVCLFVCIHIQVFLCCCCFSLFFLLSDKFYFSLDNKQLHTFVHRYVCGGIYCISGWPHLVW